MMILWVVLGVVAVFVVLMIFSSRQVAAGRRSGVYPAEGQATMADVERLARAGEKIHAIRCYREIHNCGLAEAKKAVEELPAS